LDLPGINEKRMPEFESLSEEAGEKVSDRSGLPAHREMEGVEANRIGQFAASGAKIHVRAALPGNALPNPVVDAVRAAK
jgi:hypothetical protein